MGREVLLGAEVAVGGLQAEVHVDAGDIFGQDGGARPRSDGEQLEMDE